MYSLCWIFYFRVNKIIANCKWLICIQLLYKYLFSLKTQRNLVQKQPMKVFQKDSKLWSPEQQQEVEKFFLFNSFLSKLYERRIFHKIVELAYYAKIKKGEQLFLNNNKRPEVIIVLSGEIEIFKKNVLSPSKKSRSGRHIQEKSSKEQFSSIGQYRKYNEVISMVTQAKIVSNSSVDSEILYIPASLYNSFIQQRTQETLTSIIQVLTRKFPNASKSEIKLLSESGCLFKQYKMNSIIFRTGDTAEFVCFLMQGNVRIERPDFSQKKQSLVILSPESIFGDLDLQKSVKTRENTAVSCCAYSRVLVIPKTPYLNFINSASLPEIAKKMIKNGQNPLNPQKSFNSKLSESFPKKTKLPQLMRFRISSNRSQQEQEKQQYKLIRNSHRLLDAKPRKKSLRSKSTLDNYDIDPLKQRIMLFQKIRPQKTKLTIGSPFFDYKF